MENPKIQNFGIIPQTELALRGSDGVARRPHDSTDAAETLPGSRFACFLLYKMDLTFKNTQ